MVWLFGGLTGGIVIFGYSLYRIVREKGIEVDHEIEFAKKIKSA